MPVPPGATLPPRTGQAPRATLRAAFSRARTQPHTSPFPGPSGRCQGAAPKHHPRLQEQQPAPGATRLCGPRAGPPCACPLRRARSRHPRGPAAPSLHRNCLCRFAVAGVFPSLSAFPGAHRPPGRAHRRGRGHLSRGAPLTPEQRLLSTWPGPAASRPSTVGPGVSSFVPGNVTLAWDRLCPPHQSQSGATGDWTRERPQPVPHRASSSGHRPHAPEPLRGRSASRCSWTPGGDLNSGTGIPAPVPHAHADAWGETAVVWPPRCIPRSERWARPDVGRVSEALPSAPWSPPRAGAEAPRASAGVGGGE